MAVSIRVLQRENSALVKDAGATEVHMCVSSPPVTYPCFYGIDTSVRVKLIAATHTEQEICEYIGANSLHYISMAGLRQVLRQKEQKICVMHVLQENIQKLQTVTIKTFLNRRILRWRKRRKHN